MAQNREQDETLDLQVPPCPTTTTSGCGSIARLERRESTSEEDVRWGSEARKRSSTEAGACTRWEAEKRAVNRCAGCRKRVGLTGFRCRCGDVYCWEHRYSDRHECTYDYKSEGRAAIARENPLVRAPKILKV